MTQPLISVIIVNYKTADLTLQTIETLLTNSPWLEQEGEVIVVDNASQDGSLERIRNYVVRIKNIQIIENAKNTGFAGGNNVGMKVARGKYILLLNSDTISIEDGIRPLINWMDQHNETGIASIRLLNEDRSIQSNGGYFPTLLRIFYWMFFIDDLPFIGSFIKSFHPASASFDKVKSFYTKDHVLDWVTGAFFLIRRDVIEKIGYFDEAMFMYAEEMEYCYRAWQAGYRCYYNSQFSIVHLGGKSSETKATPVLGEIKNILYFYKKHKSKLDQVVTWLLLKLGSLARIIVLGFILQRKEARTIYVQAFRTI